MPSAPERDLRYCGLVLHRVKGVTAERRLMREQQTKKRA
jgi:hypothetical protein